MEIIDFGRKDGTCLKCHRDLSESEKRSGMPICSMCISNLVDIIKGKINVDDLKEFSDDVNSFTDFITSSSKLMGLDNIIVVQVCFNVYMETVRNLGRRNPVLAKKIFKDAKGFLETELERFEMPERSEYSDGDIFDEDKDGGEDPFGKMVSRLNDMMRKHNIMNNERIDLKKGGIDNSIDNRKDIKEGDKNDMEDANSKNEEGEKIGDSGGNIVGGGNDCKNGSKRIRID